MHPFFLWKYDGHAVSLWRKFTRGAAAAEHDSGLQVQCREAHAG